MTFPSFIDMPTLLQFIKTLLMVVFGITLARKGSRAIERLLTQIPHLDPTVAFFLAGLIHYGILVVVFTAVLGQLGVQTTSIAAVIGTAGLALGLALQGTLSNCASGIMILFLRPIKVGEYIEAGDIAGKVEGIGLFATQLSTVDGIFVTATNSQLWARTIRNYTRNPTRRIDCTVGVGVEVDLEQVKALMYGVLKSIPLVLTVPEPLVVVTQITDQGTYLCLRCWARQDDFWPTHSLVHQRVRESLVRAQIALPRYIHRMD
jgi:small conductance mechanosensitive channel